MRVSSVAREWLTLLFLVAAFGSASGRERLKDYPPFKWDDVTKADWDIAKDSAKGIFDGAIIFERVVVNDSDMIEGSSVRTLYRRVRILTKDGRSIADVDVPFVTSGQRVVDVQGRTILPDGSTIPLAKDQVMEKTVVKKKGLKVKQKSFSLPGVTDNCVIEYAIRYELKEPATNWIFQADIPMLKGQLRWLYYDFTEARKAAKDFYSLFGMELVDFSTRNFTWQHMDSNRISRLVPVGKPTEYLFEVANVPAFKKEPFAPSDDITRSGLILYYGSERLPIVYWSNASSNMQENMVRNADSCAEAKKVAAQFDTIPDRSDKIASAYRWLEGSIVNMSYPDLPEAQALIKAHPVLETKGDDRVKDFDDIFKHKYAHKRDLNWAYLALLRGAGIHALAAAVTDRTQTVFLREAKFWQFDDYAVAIPDSAGNYRFYAPGEPFLQCGMVPWYNEGGKALIEGPEGKIVTIPFSEPKANQIIRQCQYTLNPDLSVSGSVLTRFGGHTGRNLRFDLLSEEEKQRDAVLRKNMGDDFPNVTLDSLRVDRLEARDQPLQVTYRVTFPPVAPQGDHLMLSPFDYLSNVNNPFSTDQRVTPISFRFAYQSNETAQLDLPAGWKIEALPHDTLWANQAGKCGFHVQESGEGIVMQRIFVLNSPNWPVENYAAVRELYQKRQDFSHMVVVLAKAQ